MSTDWSHARLSPVERYIQSLPLLDQEDLNRTDIPPAIHDSFQNEQGGSRLSMRELCSGHGGRGIVPGGFPDSSDEQAPRIRRRDCVELLTNWLSIGGSNSTERWLRGHWTIQNCNGEYDSFVIMAAFKTLVFQLRLEGPTQTVRFGSQDLYLILTACTTCVVNGGPADEVPPMEGQLACYDPDTDSPPTSVNWQIVACPKESMLDMLGGLRRLREGSGAYSNQQSVGL